jgi:hypothetical protein
MEPEAVAEYVEESRQLIETSPRMDEQNTKVRLIQPFLELLGWNLRSTEVELEYRVAMGSSTTHVDYALLVGDAPVVFVEAKPITSSLSDSDVRQLRSYMRQELEVDWGILTNGQSFEVLTKSRSTRNGEEISVVQFDLDDLDDNPDILEILSKEAIRSGKADEIAEQVARTNSVIGQLTENESQVAESVVKAIESEVGEFPIDLDEQAREFVQNLVAVLREQRQFVSEDRTTTSESEQSETGSTDGPDNPADLEPRRNLIAGTIRRSEIEGDPDAQVAVFPTRTSGIPFLKENEAWGFVRVGRNFDYVAMYVTGDVREIKYFAEVDKVVKPEDAGLERDPLDYKERAKIADDKMVVKFKSGSLYELEDPIPYNAKYPQGLRYTTLGKIREAETTDDVL